MPWWIIAFVAGVCLLQRSPTLLPLAWCALPCAMFALAAWRCRRWRFALLLIAALLAGLSLANGRAHWRLADRLEAQHEGKTLVIRGVVAGLVDNTPYGPRFRFAIEQAGVELPALVLLNAPQRGGMASEDWRPGQRWQLAVHLKRPHGNLNPGGFDYEGWLFAEGIGATGNITRGERLKLDELVLTPRYLVHRARYLLASHIRQHLAQHDYAGVVVALVVGDQSGISQQQWQLFRNTGITHLVSISGLHVTLVAGLVGSLCGLLWRRSFWLTLRLPSRSAAVLAGVGAALIYTLLAGFAVPTQRTLYMVSAAAIALLSGRKLAPSTVWLFALGVTVAFDPWAVMSMGFWLSYITVGAMLFALAARSGQASHWRDKLGEWGAAQWAATLGSLPLALWMFQQMPLMSPVANAIAIPLVGSIATPLALLGSLDPSGYLLRASHALLTATFWIIAPLADSRTVWQQAAPPFWALLLGLLGVGICLLPRGTVPRWLAIPFFLPLCQPAPAQREHASFQATVYDVGQGLAVLVQTRHHSLLFDAGPAGQGGRSVPPALRAAGISRLDALILSHDDPLHSGGAVAVLANTYAAWQIGSPPPAPFGYSAVQRLRAFQPCAAGMAWTWDGVRFSVLNPPDDLAIDTKDNDRSCVLRIDAPGASMLIPSDITKARELALVATAAPLKADVLILPNHGAKNSSTPEFSQAVAPQHLIATVGYRNPFRHPRPEIIARYQNSGASIWRTDQHGAIVVKADQQGVRLASWREGHRRYWHAGMD